MPRKGIIPEIYEGRRETMDAVIRFALCTLAIFAGIRVYDWVKGRLRDGSLGGTEAGER